jgi:hypothetical protein
MQNSTDAQDSTDAPILADAHFPGVNGDGLVLHFESGFDTMLPKHPRACALVAMLGQPTVKRFGRTLFLTWPNAPQVGEVRVGFPWPDDRRRVVRLSAPPSAFLAATRLAVNASEEAGAQVLAAKAALDAAVKAFDAALTAEERTHMRQCAVIRLQAETQIASLSDEKRHSRYVGSAGEGI